MKDDRSGFMVNLGIGLILGMTLVVIALASVYMLKLGWLEGTIIETISNYGIWIFTAGVMLGCLGITNDPRHILIVGGVAMLLWYLTFMMGA